MQPQLGLPGQAAPTRAKSAGMSNDLKYAQAIWRLRACMVRVIPTGGASFSIPVEWEWDSVWWSGSNPVEGVVQIMARKRRREPRPEKWRYTMCGKEIKQHTTPSVSSSRQRESFVLKPLLPPVFDHCQSVRKYGGKKAGRSYYT